MSAIAHKPQPQRLAQSVWLERTVRIGLVAYGVVHLLIAWLALQLAFGQRAPSASQQGALHALAQQQYGRLLLWVVAIGLVGLALWQLTEAVWGHSREEGAKRLAKRVGSAGKVVIYAAIATSAIQVAVGAGSSSHSQAMTARLMGEPFGRLMVAAVGVVIVIVAILIAKRGWTASFTKDLRAGAASGGTGTAIVRMGQIGYLAKGVALTVVGALFIWAAGTYDAKKAGGLDSALATLLRAGVGPWLLVVVALGIACFGLYCWAWSVYADTSS